MRIFPHVSLSYLYRDGLARGFAALAASHAASVVKKGPRKKGPFLFGDKVGTSCRRLSEVAAAQSSAAGTIVRVRPRLCENSKLRKIADEFSHSESSGCCCRDPHQATLLKLRIPAAQKTVRMKRLRSMNVTASTFVPRARWNRPLSRRESLTGDHPIAATPVSLRWQHRLLMFRRYKCVAASPMQLSF